jgi:hypothetical protein
VIVGIVHEELHRHLMNVRALAFMLLPYMLQLGAGDEHKVVLADNLTGISYGTPTSFTILHKVQFKDLMTVDGIGKLLLMPVGHVHEVVVGQRSYLV